MSDNKNLRYSHEVDFYVILSNNEQGIQKYISKDYFSKHGFKYTIKLNRAMRFPSVKLADRFMESNNIEGELFKCIRTLRLMERVPREE